MAPEGKVSEDAPTKVARRDPEIPSTGTSTVSTLAPRRDRSPVRQALAPESKIKEEKEVEKGRIAGGRLLCEAVSTFRQGEGAGGPQSEDHGRSSQGASCFSSAMAPEEAALRAAMMTGS